MNCVKNLSKRGVALLMALLLCINVVLFAPTQKAKAIAVVDDVVYSVLATVILAALGYEISNVMDVATEEFWRVGKPLADAMVKADAAGKVWLVGLADCWMEGWKVLKDGISVPKEVIDEAQAWVTQFIPAGCSGSFDSFDASGFMGINYAEDPDYLDAVTKCKYYFARHYKQYNSGSLFREYRYIFSVENYTKIQDTTSQSIKKIYFPASVVFNPSLTVDAGKEPDYRPRYVTYTTPSNDLLRVYDVDSGIWHYDQVAVTNIPELAGLPSVLYFPANVLPDADAVTDLPLEEDGSLTVSIPQDLPVDDTTSLPVTDSLAQGDVIAGTVDPPVPPDPPTPPAVDGLDGFKLPELITTKFPFCIPFDVLRTVQMLSAPAETPVFKIPFKADFIGVDEEITIDFSQFDTLAAIMRWMLSALFLLGLIMATRNLIKG